MGPKTVLILYIGGEEQHRRQHIIICPKLGNMPKTTIYCSQVEDIENMNWNIWSLLEKHSV
jgi:hypothetical protein